jgi:membrane fusion protein (multidrug efflux system)
MRTLSIKTVFFITSLILLPSCKEKKKVVQPEVTVFAVKNENVKEIWTLVGQTVADPKVELLARVSGFLEKRNFKQGAFVKKGELLFQIEKDQFQAYVKKAEADVAIKEALLKNAIITYKRMKLLKKKNTVSQAELDKATADKGAAIGDLNVAKAVLSEAKLNLSYTDIISPIDGRIGLTTYSVGNMIGPTSKVLATVVSLQPMRVEFSVNEAVFLRAQQKAIERKISLKKLIENLDIKLILSNDTLYDKTGKIYFWNNTVSSETGTILMRAEFDNQDFVLNPGQYVKVQIQSSIPRKALVIPQAAVQTALGGKFVMIVDEDDIIKTKNVKLGYRFESTVVVKKGLIAGDRVVTQGIQQVRSGDKVKVILTSKNNKSAKSSKNSKEKSPEKKNSKNTK